MTKIKLALLGCGDVAHRDYLPEFQRVAERAELVAVCGRTEARAHRTADAYHIPHVYLDYRQMLQEADVDAVINLTPIQLHGETNRAVLEAGKHLYSEKPLAGDAKEAGQLGDLARRRGLKLVCAPCVMIFPQVRYVASRLEEIGPIYLARGRGHGGVPPWSGYPSDPGQFFEVGGGPARDMGVYPLHALTGLLGPAKRVTAMTARAQKSFVVRDGPAQGRTVTLGEDDNWQMILDFGNQRLAAVDANNVAQATRSPEMELFGLRGTISFSVLDVSAPIEIMRAGSDWESVRLPRTGRQAGPDHLLGIEHLLDCMQHDRDPILSADHARHVIEIIDAAARSSAQGRGVELQTTFDGDVHAR